MSNWGKAHENNSIGFGQGSANNSIGWGNIYDKSFSGQTILNPSLSPFEDAISHFKFDETTGAVIDSNSGFNGTAENGVIRGVQGIKDNAFQFDGIDDYVALPNTYDFVQNTNVFTINLWVKILDLNGRNGLIGNASGSSDKGFFLLFDTASSFTKAIRFVSNRGVQGSNAQVLTSQNNVITDNDFHMITIVGLGNTGKIYLDGVELPLATNNFNALSTGVGNDVMSIGAIQRSATFSNAVIDEVSVFDTSKTQAEITEFYNFYV